MPALRGVRGACALLLASLLLLTSTPPTFAATNLSPGDAAIVANTGGDAILLRSDAGYQFAVLAQLGAGTPVTILGSVDEIT
jgi:beta-lactamase class A